LSFNTFLPSCLPFFPVVNLGFCHSFCLAFGGSVNDYRDPVMSFMTLIRLAMGDFDFAELYSANRVLGPVLFSLYTVLTFFVLVNVFIAIIGDAFEDAKEASRKDTMVVRYFKMQLKKRLNKHAMTMQRIRSKIMSKYESVEGDVVLNPAEIGEIEDELSLAGGQALQQWLTLKDEVDDDDGHLTRSEVEQLFLLMDKNVESIRVQREEIEKYGEIALDPVHKKVIEVQTKLKMMEESQSARLDKIEELLTAMHKQSMTTNVGANGRITSSPSSSPSLSSVALSVVERGESENRDGASPTRGILTDADPLPLQKGPRNKSPSGKDLVVRLEPLPRPSSAQRPSTYLGVAHHLLVRPLSAKRLPPSEVEQEHLDRESDEERPSLQKAHSHR
jgi:hypothetical protein